MSQISINDITASEDTLEGGEGVVPVGGPESGQVVGALTSLLEGMPECGLPAEQERKELAWRDSSNYAKTGERWEPTKLNSRHREIMRRIVEGSNYVQIAEQMGLHPHTVAIIATSQMFREELVKVEATATADVLKRAEVMSNEALDTLKLNMRFSKRASDRRAAAVDILGIAGYSKIEKKVVGVVDGEAVIRKLNEMRRQKLNGDLESNTGPANPGA